MCSLIISLSEILFEQSSLQMIRAYFCTNDIFADVSDLLSYLRSPLVSRQHSKTSILYLVCKTLRFFRSNLDIIWWCNMLL